MHAQKEAGGGGQKEESDSSHLVDTYKNLDILYDQLYQAPIDDLSQRMREWGGPIGGFETKGCSLGVLTLLGFMTREEAEQQIRHTVIETDRSFTAIMDIINTRGLNLVEMQTRPSDISEFFHWIEHKLQDNHLTIVKFNRTDDIGHIAIFAKIGNEFYTIDPQTQTIVQRNDKKFIGWTTLAGFTSISLPMIAFNRRNLVKFKITDEMLRGWECIDPERVKAGTATDCTFNVVTFFGILSRADARFASAQRPVGTFSRDHAQILMRRFLGSDTFKNSNEITKPIPNPTDKNAFENFINRIVGSIGAGYGIPMTASRADGTGHSFILALTGSSEVCVIDPQTAKIFLGMDKVYWYFITKHKFIEVVTWNESDKTSRHRTHMFEAEIRKQKKLDPPLKKQQLKMPSDRGVVSPGLVVLSDRGVVSPGLVVSPGQKKVVKMKKKAKKTAKLIRDMKKEVKGNKLARTLKKAKIVKLKEELAFLKKGKGKSRKLGVGTVGKYSRRRK